MRVLSIDFDYFIDTDITTRNQCFPRGDDMLSAEDENKQWVQCYKEYPHITLLNVVKPLYDVCCASLEKKTKGKVLIADSHRKIWNILSHIDKNEPLGVINIDFHHDNYISGGRNVDCANWVRHLMSERSDTAFLWVRREDSEITSLLGSFPYNQTELLQGALEGEFDYIFFCFSPEWTPPHLREEFLEMCDRVKHLERL